MNTGAFGENFPYSNFHDLNMDWIIKIAKDFLDQYTHIQDTINEGLESLDEKATNLENLLQVWYDNHSEDIANQLAEALQDINNQLSTAIANFNQSADQKAQQTIASIPSDYTALSNLVNALNSALDKQYDEKLFSVSPNFYDKTNAGIKPGYYIVGTNWTDGGGDASLGTTHPIYLFKDKTYKYPSAYGRYGQNDNYVWEIDYPGTGNVISNSNVVTRENGFNTVTINKSGWYVVNMDCTQKDTFMFCFADQYPSGYLAFADTPLANIGNLMQIERKTLSLNGNYFDFKNATWYNGVYSPMYGTVDNDYPYQYAFTPIMGAGQYIYVFDSEYGTNASYFPLLDANKKWIRYVNAVSGSSGVYTFNITEEDCKGCYYTVIRHQATNGLIPKMFYNAPASAGRYELEPEYGFASDKLYKKVLVCDGDSIAHATADLPKQFGGWFGRFKNNYQMTGQNFAISGGTITAGLYYGDGNPRHWVCRSIDDIHQNFPTLDYLLLEGGTNDADQIGWFNGDTPPEGFGTWTTTDFTGNYDDTTFCGAVESMFYKALTYWPTACIGFIIPMEMGTGIGFPRERRRYFEEIIKIAKKWHIPVLNLWDNAGVDARLTVFYDPNMTPEQNTNAKHFYRDGQHPSSYGYDKMQPMIEAWVKTL